jgi:Zn-finger nucleic acid-binding protein
MRLRPDSGSFQCDYCQRVVLPEKNDDGVSILDEPCELECPLCNAPLKHALLAKEAIFYCIGCRGMLVPMQELEGLIERLQTGQKTEDAPVAGDKDELRRKISCPQCHRTMDAHFYAGPGNAVIDSCEDCCLIWLNGGVLMQIVRASSGENPPAF